jgi:hypothetical protein
MTIDSSTIEIKGSPLKLIGLLLLAIPLVGGSLLLLSSASPASFEFFIALVGLLLFGAAMVIGFWRLFNTSTTEITITPRTILDRRIWTNPLPWTAIEDVDVWSTHGQKIIVLTVTPEAEAAMGLSKMAAWSRPLNAKLGADGVCITAQGLKMGHAELLETIIARVNAARSLGD